MKETFDDVEYASLLYDFYGELLGESRREVMDLYHEDNLSLAEIAEELGQTRQGVHYTLKRAEATLAEYERKLGLVAKHKANIKCVEAANHLADKLLSNEAVDASAKQDITELVKLIEELSE